MDTIISLFEFHNIAFFASFCMQVTNDSYWTHKRCYMIMYYINVLNETYLKQNDLKSLYFVFSCFLTMFGSYIDLTTNSILHIPIYFNEMYQVIWLTIFVNMLYQKYYRQNANIYTLYLKIVLTVFIVLSSLKDNFV